MNKTTTTLLTAVLLLSAWPLAGQTRGPASAAWTFPVEEYRLRNGLRVILSADNSLPLVSVVLAYGAGSVREQPGQAGLAFLMENLMFQGSENVGPLQHVGYIQKTGGIVNAETTPDKSLYYQTLPSNQLALALWLESDRMGSLLLSTRDRERRQDELLEEYRSRLGLEPYLESYALFDTLLYPDFAYGHPLIGSRGNLKALTDADVKSFHAAYYVPNNAVLTIVGDIQVARTKELVARYFDSIPPGEGVIPPPPPQFRQEGEISRLMEDASLPSPGFHLGYRLSPLRPGDMYAMKILQYVLSRGKSSRLYTRIMKKDLTAYNFGAILEERRGVEALKIFALNSTDVMADRCQKAVLSEFDKLKGSLIPLEELERARHLFKTDYIRLLTTNMDRALFLADAAFADIRLDALPAELDKYLRVSPQNLIILANRLFVPANKVILNIRVR